MAIHIYPSEKLHTDWAQVEIPKPAPSRYDEIDDWLKEREVSFTYYRGEGGRTWIFRFDVPEIAFEFKIAFG